MEYNKEMELRIKDLILVCFVKEQYIINPTKIKKDTATF